METLKILSIKTNNLFQSDAWADFQAGLKRKSWVVKGDNVQGLVLKYPLYKDKYYFYSPRGPIMSGKAKLQDLKLFLRKVEHLAKEENAVFYRIEPYVLDQSDIYKFGFRKMAKHAPLSAQFSPENTLVLDISRAEDKILAEMKPKWRYNINLANRKGIEVREGKGTKDIKIFYELTKEMEKRGGYTGHEYEYYEKMYETLTKGDILKIFIAEYEGKPLAAILVSYFGHVATYLHGASGNEKRELMPTYALQWAAIQEAKNRNCRLYDFWGIAPEGASNHSWAGVTRFKKGFGGQEIRFGGAYDMAFDGKYYKLLSTANRFRKLIKK
jgi:lipid II:glycine glycyltransferase (peptidoglycan interpeptide bridge formation enzyme)